ncbi:hypothetical protein JL39_22205 [Rhizobium sp. YS-1r]|nr:hypothetical protein JL39_22205 [Rhizobium sp. YS-1r]
MVKLAALRFVDGNRVRQLQIVFDTLEPAVCGEFAAIADGKVILPFKLDLEAFQPGRKLLVEVVLLDKADLAVKHFDPFGFAGLKIVGPDWVRLRSADQ